MSTQHSIRAEKFLADKKQAEWHDETLWLVRAKRDRLSKQVPEWEKLRDAACAIKMYSNSHLAELLTEFEANAVKNGAIVHWAKDAEEYRTTVLDILRSKGVRHFIKSKSMLAEECELNPFLEANGIETVESDLGERILQLMHLAPSHIVLPAIHIKREQVGKLFEKEMGTEQGNFDPTYLTHAARKNLRQKFIHAEAAMTGANFAVASTGEIVVCTNEGNADMGTSQPKLQIAAFGLEKIVPDRESLGVFTRLLSPFEGNVCAWQFALDDTVVLFAFVTAQKANPELCRVRMRGVPAGRWRDEDDGRVYDASVLERAGLPFIVPGGERLGDYTGMVRVLRRAD